MPHGCSQRPGFRFSCRTSDGGLQANLSSLLLYVLYWTWDPHHDDCQSLAYYYMDRSSGYSLHRIASSCLLAFIRFVPLNGIFTADLRSVRLDLRNLIPAGLKVWTSPITTTVLMCTVHGILIGFAVRCGAVRCDMPPQLRNNSCQEETLIELGSSAFVRKTITNHVDMDGPGRKGAFFWNISGIYP